MVSFPLDLITSILVPKYIYLALKGMEHNRHEDQEIKANLV